VIKKSAALLKAGLPKHAACCRFDGEKFGILIPKCTLAEAMGIADDLRMRLAAAKLLHNRALTASFGVSVALQAGKAQAEQLTQRAMDALQFSKSHGRNMVSSNIAE
jgi:diguanylate cyclase (GGDEF)-like protein